MHFKSVWHMAAWLIAFMPVLGQESGSPLKFLTEKEIREGWIALYDGSTSYGWKSEGSVDWQEGVIKLGGKETASITTTSAFSSFDLAMECRYEGSEGGFEFHYAHGVSKMKAKENPMDPSFSPVSFHCPGKDKTRAITLKTLPGTTMYIRHLKLKPLEMKSLFDGRSMTGWKPVETANTKTEYSITADGELRLQNGPGDLHTEQTWDDFILQIDVKSNGKHLNSGVFFRCTPGQFWSGYEAQIRNQWQGDDREKPVDFGTGGLYNRQPARRVVSDDHRYFTMTILAHGTHMATWVDGYQVTDFIDTARLGTNARRGAKTAAGTISLQGHDPTTDLFFKNIRISPLPKGQ